MQKIGRFVSEVYTFFLQLFRVALGARVTGATAREGPRIGRVHVVSFSLSLSLFPSLAATDVVVSVSSGACPTFLSDLPRGGQATPGADSVPSKP